MKKFLIATYLIIAWVTLLLPINNAFGDEVFTGNDFLKWSVTQRTGYLYGYYHGLAMCLTIESANPNNDQCLSFLEIRPIVKAIKAMSGDQFHDVFLKYLEDFPERRHLALAFLIYGCMNDVAIKLGYKEKKAQS